MNKIESKDIENSSKLSPQKPYENNQNSKDHLIINGSTSLKPK